MNIKAFKLITGDEIVCELVSSSKNSHTIRNACSYEYIPIDNTYILSIQPFLRMTVFNQDIKISKESVLIEIDPIISIKNYFVNTLKDIEQLSNNVLEVYNRRSDSDNINNYIEDNNTYH